MSLRTEAAWAMPFSTWMYRIAVNTALSFARSDRRRQQPLTPLDAELAAGHLAAPEPGELWDLRRAIEGLGSFEKALVLLALERCSSSSPSCSLPSTSTRW